MNKLSKKIVTLILLLSVGIQNISQASEPTSAKGRPAPVASPSATPSSEPSPKAGPTPEELENARKLIGKCDKALSSCDTLVKDKDEKIKQQDEILRATDKELAELKSDRDNILKNPILWGVIGMVVGALAAGAIATRR